MLPFMRLPLSVPSSPWYVFFGLEFCTLPFDLKFAFDLNFVHLVCTLFSNLGCCFAFVQFLVYLPFVVLVQL